MNSLLPLDSTASIPKVVIKLAKPIYSFQNEGEEFPAFYENEFYADLDVETAILLCPIELTGFVWQFKNGEHHFLLEVLGWFDETLVVKKYRIDSEY